MSPCNYTELNIIVPDEFDLIIALFVYFKRKIT